MQYRVSASRSPCLAQSVPRRVRASPSPYLAESVPRRVRASPSPCLAQSVPRRVSETLSQAHRLKARRMQLRASQITLGYDTAPRGTPLASTPPRDVGGVPLRSNRSSNGSNQQRLELATARTSNGSN